MNEEVSQSFASTHEFRKTMWNEKDGSNEMAALPRGIELQE